MSPDVDDSKGGKPVPMAKTMLGQQLLDQAIYAEGIGNLLQNILDRLEI